MTQKIIMVVLLIALICLYYQNRKLKGLSATTENSSRTIFELGEDQEELIAEKDAAIRSKNEAEAETLALNNRLKNKQQEVSRKEQEIERLKKEKSSSEISLNKKISEKNGLITTLQREVNQQKEKYSKQGKLLDEEQLENNKLIQQHQEQLRKINLLFDPNASNYAEIDFNGLYELLKAKVK
jgi:transcriptional regulator of acetoin/glycerol metabolism